MKKYLLAVVMLLGFTGFAMAQTHHRAKHHRHHVRHHRHHVAHKR
jgi:hypothetical protein